MNAQQTNKLRAYLATQAVLEDNEAAWQTLPAFAEAAGEFKAVITEINDLAQTQASRNGSADEKDIAFEAMGNTTYETAGAVLAYADKEQNHDLAGRVDFSRSAITDGRESAVVARCRDIAAAATTVADSLADYGITPAKLTGLKKKIDAFEAVQPGPRKKAVTGSAATKALINQFATADSILSRRMDGLAYQFRETQTDFFNQYNSARYVVDNPGGRKAVGPPEPVKNP